MSFIDDVEKLLKPVENNSRPLAVTPDKPTATAAPWIAGVELDGDSGEIRTKPLFEPNVSWNEQLASWGFNPDLYEVIEPVRVSTWQVLTKDDEGDYVERQLWAYRARIQTRRPIAAPDFDELCKPIKAVKKYVPKDTETDFALIVPIGDWQIGKSDGDGLEGTIARINASIEAVANRVHALRKLGYKVNHLVVVSAGDLHEGCSGHYEQQTFSVQLDRRDQTKVVRRLMRNALIAWAQLFDKITVAAVGGNHGENRRDSKSFTSTNDNDDVAIFEQLAEAFNVNPDAFGHIEWILPRGELSISFEVANTVVGLAHGHQARNNDLVRWWSSQILSNRAVASADILITGHFHHLKIVEAARGKWWIQIPAMDGGSEWFEEMAGHGNTAGQVTMLVADGKWSELQVV